MSDTPKPQMRFTAREMDGEYQIAPACPHSDAWLQSMGKRYIKATDLHWVGKMGIEVAMVSGPIKGLQKALGKDGIDKNGTLLRGRFDMLDQSKK